MISLASHAIAGRRNEDAILAAPGLVVIVDGAGVPLGGCTHGVAWYANQLAALTMTALIDSPDVDLREALAQGISLVAGRHSATCDLTSPNTPCAAVGVLRVGVDLVEALALSDVSIAVDAEGDVHVTTDLSIEELNGTEQGTTAGLLIGSPEHGAALDELVKRQTATRNQPGGWWVAAADPAAAKHAVVNNYPRGTCVG